MTVVTIYNETGIIATSATEGVIIPIAVNKLVTVKIINHDAANDVNWTVNAFHYPIDTTKRISVPSLPSVGIEIVQATGAVGTANFDDVQIADNKAFTHLLIEYIRVGGTNADPITIMVLGRPSL